jgi:predicted acylesterase/phospholipase RssA
MEYLVLGPAGMGMFTLAGSIMKYEDELKHIKEISGSSAGAIVAVGIALSIPTSSFLERLLSADFVNLTKFKIRSFLTTFGFVSVPPIREALVKVYGCDPTFAELEKKVYISSYCMNRARTEYFSVDTHPHMKVVDAVCMSLAIPIVISPVVYNGMMYIDGGTKESFPITPFIDKNPEKIMCIRVKQRDVFIDEIKNFNQFLKAMVSSALCVNESNTIKLGRMVFLDITPEEMFKFSMSHEEKLRLFLKGTVS